MENLTSNMTSGMNYYYHRYYKPEIGRFLNEDPIGMKSDYNYYKFANNNPINNFDLYGLRMSGMDPIKCATIIMNHYYNEMRNMNWKGQDLYFHCLASCKAAKICGKFSSISLGILREMSQFYEPPLDHHKDMNANMHGISCPKKMRCEDRCRPLAHPWFRARIK